MDPGVIIFVNNDLTSNVQTALVRQLFISEVITGTEFDARVAKDPNYPFIIHANNLRILVVRSFYDFTNRSLADVVIFVKAGLASVEASKVGPPGLTLPVDRLYLHELLQGTIPVNIFTPNPNAQNNVLFPLSSDQENQEIHLAPFGTDNNEEFLEFEDNMEPELDEE